MRVFRAADGSCKENVPDALNSLAWIQATNAKQENRNPREAIRLARGACDLTNYSMPEVLDTLAAAYAAAGDFSGAIETAKKAVRLAESSGKSSLVKEIQSRIELYQNQQPYYD